MRSHGGRFKFRNRFPPISPLINRGYQIPIDSICHFLLLSRILHSHFPCALAFSFSSNFRRPTPRFRRAFHPSPVSTSPVSSPFAISLPFYSVSSTLCYSSPFMSGHTGDAPPVPRIIILSSPSPSSSSPPSPPPLSSSSVSNSRSHPPELLEPTDTMSSPSARSPSAQVLEGVAELDALIAR